MMKPDVFLSLGSNHHPEQNLRHGVLLLQEQCEVLEVLRVSSLYRTPPAKGARLPYYNAALLLHTDLAPLDLKINVLREIEREVGRVHDPQSKEQLVALDLDIVLWGDFVMDYGDKPWQVPDPDLLLYAYVTVPLAEIAPDALHPETGQSLAEIAAGLNQSGIERLPLLAI